MPRRCFYSFHYDDDNWRVSTVRQIGAIEGQPLLSGNKWEEVERAGGAAIRKWIDDNMSGRSALVVLVGSRTAERPWVDYEIKKAWELGKGVMGIRIHNLRDSAGNQSLAGADPFAKFNINGSPFTTWAKTYSPPSTDSQQVYAHIAAKIEAWVEEAIRLRASA